MHSIRPKRTSLQIGTDILKLLKVHLQFTPGSDYSPTTAHVWSGGDKTHHQGIQIASKAAAHEHGMRCRAPPRCFLAPRQGRGMDGGREAKGRDEAGMGRRKGMGWEMG